MSESEVDRKKMNRFKESPRFENRKQYSRNHYETNYSKYSTNSFFQKDKDKEKPKIFTLIDDDFPDFIPSVDPAKKNVENGVNEIKLFTEILEESNKVVNDDSGQDQNKFILKPGWILLNKNENYNDKLEDVEMSNADITNFINGLAALYDKQTKRYIDLYGEDMFVRTYKFPNYDYEYFDKLDELEDLEMAEHGTDMSDENYDIDDIYYEVD